MTNFLVCLNSFCARFRTNIIFQMLKEFND